MHINQKQVCTVKFSLNHHIPTMETDTGGENQFSFQYDNNKS